MQPFLIGVFGGSGSGKTTFVDILRAVFSEDEVCLVNQDNYYKSIEDMPVDANGYENFDLPITINKRALRHDIERLIAGETFEIPKYLFNNALATPEMLMFRSAPIIIVEGLFVMHYKKIKALFDLSVFVDCSDTNKVIRRIKRDALERNYNTRDVMYRYEHHVSPSYRRYIEFYRDEADVVVNNNKDMLQGVLMMTGFLAAKLGKPFDANKVVAVFEQFRR